VPLLSTVFASAEQDTSATTFFPFFPNERFRAPARLRALTRAPLCACARPRAPARASASASTRAVPRKRKRARPRRNAAWACMGPRGARACALVCALVAPPARERVNAAPRASQRAARRARSTRNGVLEPRARARKRAREQG
jgi:hypothetical protein